MKHLEQAIRNTSGVSAILLLSVLPFTSVSQCGTVAQITPLHCGDAVLPTIDTWIELEVTAGSPPFQLWDPGGGGSYTIQPGQPTQLYFVYGLNTSSFDLEDANGCVTTINPSAPLPVLTGGYPIYAPNQCSSSCPNPCPGDPAICDGGILYDPNTGMADVRLGDLPHRWEFYEASSYALSGPVSMSGTIISLPPDPLTATCPCSPRVLPDLPPGNYTLTSTNNTLPSTFDFQGTLLEDCNYGIPMTNNFTVPVAPFTLGDGGVNVTPQIALQGAMPSTGTLMDDDLRGAGMLPLTEPYSALGYSYTDPASAGAFVPQSMFNGIGNDAIVDWVVVEVRSESSPFNVLASRPALVRRDGDVVDLDGDDYVNFPTLSAGNYRVAVRHRNHLGIMSGASEYLHVIPKEINLRSGSHYGAGATTTINGAKCMWAGNVNFDDEISYTGLGNDRDPILVSIGGSVPTNTTMGYSTSDVNMDGTIKYTGPGNDRDPILQNIGGSVPTNVRVEQLP